jgi:NADH-quinone oxidoreductase subunit G
VRPAAENIDCRLRQTDFSLDGRNVVPWLGMPIADIPMLDRVLVVGSFLRKDHPLLAQRLRQAAKKFTRVSLLHVADDDQLIALQAKSIVAPSALATELAGIVKAVAEAKGAAVDAALAGVQPSAAAKRIAESLASGEKGAIFLGNFAQQHAQAATLHALAQQLAELTGARFGTLGEAANSVGGYLAKAVPGAQGLNAARMLAEPRKAYFVLHAEPELDCANPGQAMAALKGADLVVALTPFKTRALDYAHVILPVAPFTETSGTFINTEGRVQSFHAVVKPQGETRPGLEGAARAGQPARTGRLRAGQFGSRAQRGAGRQDGFGRRAPEQPGRWRCDRSCLRCAGAATNYRRADPFRRSAGAPRAVAAEDPRCGAARRPHERRHAGEAGPDCRHAGQSQYHRNKGWH